MLSNLLASKTGKHADVEVVVGKGREGKGCRLCEGGRGMYKDKS